MKQRIFFYLFLIAALCATRRVNAQVWIPDNGDGTYKNPIIYADYSDPDVIRVGDNYYMVASSFTCQPGIPVLHSKDLVNWRIINYVYDRLPLQKYDQVQHGQGSWAPSIRYYKGTYFVYFCTPDDGLFMASSKDPGKNWDLNLIYKVSGWEDPCPFWDEDGKAYLLHGKLGGGPAILHKMSSDGKRLLDEGRLIYDDRQKQPVLEGFKFMEKKDGYYYFAAPAGGVSTGWQSVFRSKNIYGPYEDKIVLNQGATPINGPHQGGLVETQKGEWWFIHFQAKGAYGRIVHLQPAAWRNGWPVIGSDKTGDGTGEPVESHRKPNVGKEYPITVPQTSDDFSSSKLGLQWQWQAAPQDFWYSLKARKGFVRLNAVSNTKDNGNLTHAGNVLLQKFTAPVFTATTKLEFHGNKAGESAGLTVMGNYYTYLAIEKQAKGLTVVLYEGERDWEWLKIPKAVSSQFISSSTAWLRVAVTENAKVNYSYSLDGKTFYAIGGTFGAREGTWIGAKVGIVCTNRNSDTTGGYADFDSFIISK
ncbi:glycoside hydrolase family 43 protein [Desertivirga arenae]|uniref:glycoside hydrolase family 43 protein n=1 Tax=Desertivirga arenae TaxID=2810309 RepID=UPI001A968DEC|nr:glycoside hydrolase 43 family protein [Pedobacter sp. SYSU D00823]